MKGKLLLKAAVYHGPKDIKLEEVPEPKVAARKVAVKFKAGSICGTDLHFLKGEWKIKPGRIIGHDACGVRVDTGERVVMIPFSYCGTCYFCLRGLPSLCERYGRFMGIDRNGFFAETIAMRPKYLVPVPHGVSDEESAIMEPVALAVHVFDLLRPSVNDWVTVVGQGPIGLVMTQVAKLKSCKVIAIDLQDYRLELAKKYGAEVCINANEEKAIAKVREITKRGSDLVVEAAGSLRAVEQTTHMVRKAGKVALVGEFRGRMNFEDADEALFFTTYLSPVEYPVALELVANGLVDVKGLITHRFRLSDFEKAMHATSNPAEKPIKVVVTE